MPSKPLRTSNEPHLGPYFLSRSLPSIHVQAALCDTMRLLRRANRIILATDSWVTRCRRRAFSLAAPPLSPHQQSPSRSSPFQAHFAHVSILCPPLLLSMSCRSTSVQHDSPEFPFYIEYRLPISPLRLSWTHFILLRLILLSPAPTTPSSCGSTFTLL